MKKNSFIQGAVIATLCIVISKILGVIYVIPFYSLIGEKGGALYGYAYSIYGLFLNLSTAGIPFAISKITSEYSALKQYYLKEKSYIISKYLMCGLGVFGFVVLMFFAPFVADIFIGDIKGGNTKEDVAFVIRVISFALLIVPILSVTRGYLQGHKFITPSSISQVIEQFVRVLIIVIGTFLCLRVFDLELRIAIGIAVFSAVISAFVSYIYLKIKVIKNKEAFNLSYEITEDEKKVTSKDIAFRLLAYAIPFILLDIVSSAYSFVDLSTINRTMVSLGYDISESESVISVLTTWGSKLNMIVMAVSSGMIVSLVPNIASSYVVKDYKDVKNKINEALQSLIFVILPMTVGLSLISNYVWTIFFGSNSSIGPLVFSYSIFTAFTMSIFNITVSTMHSLGHSKMVINTLTSGLIVKIIINIPFMKLFNYIGLHPSYGVITSTLLSNVVVIIFNLIFLKKKLNIKYKDTFITFIKNLIPLSVMIFVVLIMKKFIPISTSRIMCLIYSFIYAIVGGLVYIIVSMKTKLVYNIFGNNIINKIKTKFKIN